jgi:hypothetical protein
MSLNLACVQLQRTQAKHERGKNKMGATLVRVIGSLTKTIQTQNAVNVALSGTSTGTWIDCDGFDSLSVTFQSDAAVNNTIDIHWSNDGTTQHAFETILTSQASAQRAARTTIKARYARVKLTNGDAGSAHIMSCWVYLNP